MMGNAVTHAATLLCWGLLAFGSAPADAACKVESPAHRIGLLELFTSEGCSSCPPADQWLTRLRTVQDANHLVALAFHVDYWNQLGWPDRFAQNLYTRRQQAAAERNRAGFVYTPQFLLDGEDIRPLQFSGLLKDRLTMINAEAAAAHIHFEAAIDAQGMLTVRGRSRTVRPDAAALTYIALYEHGLSSRVAKGENAGRHLRHDYVVRSLLGPFAANAQGEAPLDQRLPLPPDANRKSLGLAVFTQDGRTGRVLQASAAEGCVGLPERSAP